VWLRRFHDNWQRAARIPPDPAVASRRTDADHRSGYRYSGGKTGSRRRHAVLRADGRGDGYRGGADFPSPPRGYSAVRRGVYRFGDLGDRRRWLELLAALLASVRPWRAGLPRRPGLAFPCQLAGEKRPGFCHRRRARRGAGGKLWLDV
jgi:hypothetical protein